MTTAGNEQQYVLKQDGSDLCSWCFVGAEDRVPVFRRKTVMRHSWQTGTGQLTTNSSYN